MMLTTLGCEPSNSRVVYVRPGPRYFAIFNKQQQTTSGYRACNNPQAANDLGKARDSPRQLTEAMIQALDARPVTISTHCTTMRLVCESMSPKVSNVSRNMMFDLRVVSSKLFRDDSPSIRHVVPAYERRTDAEKASRRGFRATLPVSVVNDAPNFPFLPCAVHLGERRR